MNSADRNSEAARPSESGKKNKKPYSKPAFRFERVFETSALACGKTQPTQHGCRPRGKS